MMDIRRNSEGYADPTAFAALRTVINTEYPRTYIISPYAGDTDRNVANAIRYCRFALERGRFPVAPHIWLPLFMNDNIPAERELALSFGLRLLSGCREAWVFGEHISDGMRREINDAIRKHIKIRRFTATCDELPTDTRSVSQYKGEVNG